MRMLEEEFGEYLQIVWRSFLLRPRPDPGRTLEQFRAYTRSWTRVGQQPDSGVFRVWESDEGPPTHSIPPHLAAKAAAAVGADAFEQFHERLFSAYFAENRDISASATLSALWDELGLPPQALRRADDPDVVEQVIAEHNEAVSCGADGVPAFRSEGTDAVVTGAHPIEFFRNWMRRLLRGEPEPGGLGFA